MAEYGNLIAETYQAAADLREKIYHIVRFAGAGTPNLCNQASHNAAAAGVGAIGVLQNKPNSGQFASVAYFGRSKVVAGGAATAGQWWTTNGSGRAVDAASGNLVIGRGMSTAANDGEVVSVQLMPPFRLSGAI